MLERSWGAGERNPHTLLNWYRCCQRAWSSSDQVLVLCHQKEFKGKVNSKQESARLIQVNLHTQEASVGERETRENEREGKRETDKWRQREGLQEKEAKEREL